MTKTLSVRVSVEEWKAFRKVCSLNNVHVQDLLHGMVKDAIADQEYVIQCRGPERRSECRETSEAMGATET